MIDQMPLSMRGDPSAFGAITDAMWREVDRAYALGALEPGPPGIGVDTDTGDVAVLVWRDDTGRVRGVSYVVLRARLAVVISISAHPDWRRRGIGSALADAIAERWLPADQAATARIASSQTTTNDGAALRDAWMQRRYPDLVGTPPAFADP